MGNMQRPESMFGEAPITIHTTFEIEPYSLVGVTDDVVAYDDMVHLNATTRRSRLIFTNGPVTVPADGQFMAERVLGPTRIKATSTTSPPEYWVRMSPCGKEPDALLCTSREGGFIILETPDADGYVWIAPDPFRLWHAGLIGTLGAASNYLTSPTIAIAALTVPAYDAVNKWKVVDSRLTIIHRDGDDYEDGEHLVLAYGSEWEIVASSCAPVAQLEGLDPTP
jgi:hypothetical protein